MKLPRRALLAGAFAASWAGVGHAQPSLSAEQTIAAACAEAAHAHKGVLVEFYASWCAWCRPMQRFLEADATQRIVASRFTILRIQALERRAEQTARQLAGANDVYHRYAPNGAGLPFLTFLTAEGRVLTTSMSSLNGESIGFPVTEIEVEGFDAMFAIAAPDMTSAERAELRRLYVSLAPA